MTKEQFKALKDSDYITIRNRNGKISKITQIGKYRNTFITMLEKEEYIAVLSANQFTSQECEPTKAADYDELIKQEQERFKKLLTAIEIDKENFIKNNML